MDNEPEDPQAGARAAAWVISFAVITAIIVYIIAS